MIYALILLIIGILIEHLLGVPIGKIAVGIPILSLLLLAALLKQRRWVAGVLLSIAIVLLGIFSTKYDTPKTHHAKQPVSQSVLSSPASQSVQTPSSSGVIASITAFMDEKRKALSHLYSEQGLTDSEYAIAMAMTLGEKQHVSSELRDVYSITGSSHVFALSGMHLGILFMLLTVLLPTFSMPRLSAFVQLLALWTYVLLVGIHPSILRAAIMFTIYTLIGLFQNHPTSISALFFTAFITLLFSPLWLFDVGFQMSFMAVLSILILYPRINNAVSQSLGLKGVDEDTIFDTHTLRHAIVATITSITILSFTAQLGVAPLVAYYFHRFSCYFWLTNLVVSPLSFIILASALLMFLALLLSHVPLLGFMAGVASFFAWTLKGTITALNSALAWIAQLPMASFDNIHINTLQTLLIYVLIVAILLFTSKFNSYFNKKRW